MSQNSATGSLPPLRTFYYVVEHCMDSMVMFWEDSLEIQDLNFLE